MSGLITRPNIDGVDDLYEQLIAMHAGLSLADSLKVSARLNLLLINHVGDRQIVEQAIAAAKGQPRG